MYNFNDANSPRSANSGYCAVRALVIAEDMDWKDAERHVRVYAKAGKTGGTISRGVFKEDYDAALKALGFKWVSAPSFEGRKAKAADLKGTVIARQARHFVCVIDGVVNDVWDCSHKMIYGYWAK
jgi:hypothetical protein